MAITFSIITVCFNSELTIERTLQSVLNQTYQDYEYIIIDGASTDKTLSIVRKYESRFNGKMTIISEPDKGIYDAMNKGIRMAKGNLIGIVNSDDYYEPDALEHIVQVYDGYEYSIIYGLLRTVLKGQEVMVCSKNPAFIERDMITHPTCFISRAVYQDYGLYSLQYKYSADYEFMLRIRNEEKIRYVGLYDIISNFSIDGASASGKAYMETIKLKHAYGLLNDRRYYYEIIKTRLALLLKG